MKSRLKKNYISRINKLMRYAKGWPLSLILADKRPIYNAEWRGYKALDKYARTKKGREDGSYEIHFGHVPSRLSHGKSLLV